MLLLVCGFVLGLYELVKGFLLLRRLWDFDGRSDIGLSDAARRARHRLAVDGSGSGGSIAADAHAEVGAEGVCAVDPPAAGGGF